MEIKHHPNNILSLQMREQAIYIYGLKCHIFNTMHKQVDLHVYILKASNAYCPKLISIIVFVFFFTFWPHSALRDVYSHSCFNVWIKHLLKIRHILANALLTSASKPCLSFTVRSCLKFELKEFSICFFIAGWQWIERFWRDLEVCGVLRDRLQTLVRKGRESCLTSGLVSSLVKQKWA